MHVITSYFNVCHPENTACRDINCERLQNYLHTHNGLEVMQFILNQYLILIVT